MNIEKYLLKNNFNPTQKGFDLIIKAVELVREDKSYKHAITTRLYPKLAELFNDSPQKVERAIRNCISCSDVTMTNSKFIALAEIQTR